MPPVVLKLFAGQVPGGQTKRRLYASPSGEHKKSAGFEGTLKAKLK